MEGHLHHGEASPALVSGRGDKCDVCLLVEWDRWERVSKQVDVVRTRLLEPNQTGCQSLVASRHDAPYCGKERFRCYG